MYSAFHISLLTPFPRLCLYQLSQHDQQLSDAQTQLRQLERREEQTLNELSRLKEEMSDLLTQIHSLKDSNFQLTEALEKAVDRAEAFKERSGSGGTRSNGRWLEMVLI